MISQTKHAIDKLKKAGLKRSQFRVRTPRDSKGEYDRANISIRDPSIAGIDWAEKLAAAGLYVTVLKFEKSAYLIVEDKYSYNGTVQIQDHTAYPPKFKNYKVI